MVALQGKTYSPAEIATVQGLSPEQVAAAFPQLIKNFPTRRGIATSKIPEKLGLKTIRSTLISLTPISIKAQKGTLTEYLREMRLKGYTQSKAIQALAEYKQSKKVSQQPNKPLVSSIVPVTVVIAEPEEEKKEEEKPPAQPTQVGVAKPKWKKWHVVLANRVYRARITYDSGRNLESHVEFWVPIGANAIDYADSALEALRSYLESIGYATSPYGVGDMWETDEDAKAGLEERNEETEDIDKARKLSFWVFDGKYGRKIKFPSEYTTDKDISGDLELRKKVGTWAENEFIDVQKKLYKSAEEAEKPQLPMPQAPTVIPKLPQRRVCPECGSTGLSYAKDEFGNITEVSCKDCGRVIEDEE